MLIQVIDGVLNKLWDVIYAYYLTIITHHFIKSSTKVATARAYVQHFIAGNELIS